MEETISFKEIIQIIRKRINLIILVSVITLILATIYTFFIKVPQYEASTQILINQTQESEQPITSSELQSSRELINTYNVIMTSPIILEEVINQTNFESEVNDLQSKIQVSSEEESQVVTLSVTDANPQLANELANTIAEVFEQEITNIMNIDNVSILSSSQIEDLQSPVSPQPILNLLIALFFGIILGGVLAFLLEFLDQTVKSEEDVEKNLKLPVLGSISIIDSKDNNNFKENSRAN